jgi:hypothetical protein
MIKDLIDIANTLDQRGLTKEADEIDSIVVQATKDPNPFRLITTKPEDMIKSKEGPGDLRDTRELEEWRENNIRIIKDEANVPNLPDIDREVLASDLKFYIDATHEDLIKDMRREENLKDSMEAFRGAGWTQGAGVEPSYSSLDKAMNKAFEEALSHLVEAYGEENLLLSHQGGFDGYLLEEMRLDTSGFFEAVSKMVQSESIDLISMLSILMKESMPGRDDGVSVDFWNWKEILKPLTERHPIQARWIISQSDNEELKAELEEYLDQ